MRLLSLALIGVSALALSACDELTPNRKGSQQATADCCCKDRCPARAPAPAKADVEAGKTVEVATAEQTVRTGGHVRKVVRHGRGGGESSYRYSYRSGTEGVGYLDEGDYSGGYRRVGGSVSVEESESYSESARYSESGYSYSSSGGGVVAYDGGGRGHGRRGGGYAGTDRDGYLTWPGKTE
ncbi:hypothetical protein [Caulobacter sp. NIBR1757]|uniref:hypothetical protein n=1 Tax=Caulobacter sp. NIBR1757 TaxID=3016000 RepID=UPI0022F031A5|nr:hypothetical protein [Caulobacter sp. NIBR1757]WGM41147.1 hypothetical protein AMEJIAPC_04096 [Caulobacter sp. NIBR1757]